ncbi:MAG: hypothetical protein NXI04_06315 [Planctomycetaceae bacterium]|nr:hypothetical protein [Planctomycetaceae bacterium]
MNRFSSLCLTVGLLFCQSAAPAATTPQEDGPAAAIEGDSRVTVTVGMEGFMKQVVLPGSELTVREVDPRRTPVALRIDAVFPHGDELRYDLTFFGLEPGSHNITDYLVRKDGSATDDLPALPVTIKSLLPADDVRPSAPPQGFLTRIGGYQTAMILAGVIWLLGLFAILFLGRGKQDPSAETTAVAEVSEVEQIRRLINEAMEAEELSADRKAQLDMKVLNFWRSRRHIEDASVSDALEQLREDEQAGPLLAGLERWFYSRNAPSAAEIRQMLDQMKQHSLSEQPATGGVS